MGLSNVENILQSIVDSEEYKQNPQSRVEELLLEVKEVIEQGGGGGQQGLRTKSVHQSRTSFQTYSHPRYILHLLLRPHPFQEQAASCLRQVLRSQSHSQRHSTEVQSIPHTEHQAIVQALLRDTRLIAVLSRRRIRGLRL